MDKGRRPRKVILWASVAIPTLLFLIWFTWNDITGDYSGVPLGYSENLRDVAEPIEFTRGFSHAGSACGAARVVQGGHVPLFALLGRWGVN